jgi:Leucine-rich repeat (LRR) protein
LLGLFTEVLLQGEKGSKMFKLLLVVIALFAAPTFAQTNFRCDFGPQLNPNFVEYYTCSLIRIDLAGENERVIFSGDHQPGMTNSDVKQVDLRNSNTPFIIPETFRTFPFLEFLEINFANLRTIRPGVFVGADNLGILRIFDDPLDPHLQADTFMGLTRLYRLSLIRNPIRTIDVNAFRGLENLETLQIDRASMFQLSPNVFSHLTRLSWLDININFISRIERGTFAGLGNLRTLNLNGNAINAIYEDFGSELRSLTRLSLLSNVCVNSSFPINAANPDASWNLIRESLSVCFANFRI